MRFSLALDEFGRLACVLGDEQEEHTVYAAEPPAALDDLAAALEAAECAGAGECVWPIASGEYRWVMRRVGGAMRLAVMFLRSVAIGYQHVYWGEFPARELGAAMHAEIARFRSAAA